mmetsp:Transcript_1899/g.5567  ORF Transcript_1899/g.5567 Transcript_1899/m.5567 type:complete len:206 (+) Transcript_1899:1974-2591(+)
MEAGSHQCQVYHSDACFSSGSTCSGIQLSYVGGQRHVPEVHGARRRRRHRRRSCAKYNMCLIARQLLHDGEQIGEVAAPGAQQGLGEEAPRAPPAVQPRLAVHHRVPHGAAHHHQVRPPAVRGVEELPGVSSPVFGWLGLLEIEGHFWSQRIDGMCTVHHLVCQNRSRQHALKAPGGVAPLDAALLVHLEPGGYPRPAPRKAAHV